MSGHSPRSSERNRSNSSSMPIGIDGGDAERIAHGAVGRRSAPLHQDPLLAAELDDVPDDQEVPSEIETLDHAELVLELSANPRRDRSIASRGRHAPRAARRCPMASRAVRELDVGKSIAKIRERELTTIGDPARVANRFRHVAEQRRHFPCRSCRCRSAFGSESTTGIIERRFQPKAREDVEQAPIFRPSVVHVVGGDERQPSRLGQRDESTRDRASWPLEVAANLDVQIVLPEQ